MTDDRATRIGRALSLSAIALGIAVVAVILIFGRDPHWGVWPFW